MGNEPNDCAVCLASMEEGVVQTLKCGHAYHEPCIHKWLHKSPGTCPLCRSTQDSPHPSPPSRFRIDRRTRVPLLVWMWICGVLCAMILATVYTGTSGDGSTCGWVQWPAIVWLAATPFMVYAIVVCRASPALLFAPWILTTTAFLMVLGFYVPSRAHEGCEGELIYSAALGVINFILVPVSGYCAIVER